jgi:hypothetical protein
MTTVSIANLSNLTGKYARVTERVVSQAASDTLSGIEVDGGTARGGVRVHGAIPEDIGFLKGSLISTLYGNTSLTAAGEDSHVLIAGSMRVGDVARFAWTAEYAAAVHYGANGKTGTFWIDVATSKWQATVANAVRKVRAELG